MLLGFTVYERTPNTLSTLSSVRLYVCSNDQWEEDARSFSSPCSINPPAILRTFYDDVQAGGEPYTFSEPTI